jgi:tripartite-type tricarboxylate transporter receptor subunit TctC
MTIPRRHFLGLMTGALVFPDAARADDVQAYPTRPVRVIVPFAPGSAVDVFARMMGRWLTERLGQPFVIENRLGAGGNVAAEFVAHAPADGYTLLVIGAYNTINATLYDRLAFDFLSDVVPIAGIARTPNVMEVCPALPVTNVPQFITYAKANPGKVTMASPGIGTSQHVFGELFMMMTGVELVHVPYRNGSQALTDLIGGQVQVMFDTLPQSIGHIRAGELRALAVTTANRSKALPDVPPLADSVPGFEASGWQGIGAPHGAPVEMVTKLNRAIEAGLADPGIESGFAELGATPLVESPADLSKLVLEDTEKWAKVIKFAGIKPL